MDLDHLLIAKAQVGEVGDTKPGTPIPLPESQYIIRWQDKCGYDEERFVFKCQNFFLEGKEGTPVFDASIIPTEVCPACTATCPLSVCLICDWSQANVIFLCLRDDLMELIEPTLVELLETRPNCRVVTHLFHLLSPKAEHFSEEQNVDHNLRSYRSDAVPASTGV
jgi:hypothetical protein